MTERYDAIVVGVGGMGSAACYQMARRGMRVLGLERFGIPNSHGSSHGHTRIYRLAYWEDPAYVPLMLRAFELWRELEEQSAVTLLRTTGSVDAGPDDGEIFVRSLDSCRIHGLRHEVLDSDQLSDRFPGYRLPPTFTALFQPDGGFLYPESCITAAVQLSRSLGADVRDHERVTHWEAVSDHVIVHTSERTYEASQLVLTVGAFAGKCVPELAQLVAAERQVVAWFELLEPAKFQPDTFPVFNIEVEEGRYYGFPEALVPGFKLGRYHHRDEIVDPDLLDRDLVEPADEEILRRAVRRYFPAAAGKTLATQVCLFENSPDERFIIDTLPGNTRVKIAAGFSGHGFKFCTVVGEILADLVEHGNTTHAIDLFALGRFTN